MSAEQSVSLADWFCGHYGRSAKPETCWRCAIRALREAGVLLRADICCHNGCGCEEYDYCAADEWDNLIVRMESRRA